MNQDKISETIKMLRKKHNLTQEKFAEKYNVTYQAVSKWENGKNIPDINVLKMICSDFNIDINELLDNKIKNNKIFILPIILIVLTIIILIIFLFNKNDFNFQTISSSCPSFDISGSIAYNEKQSNLFISNIEYCGEEDLTKYKQIECVLFEDYNKQKIIIGQKIFNEKVQILEQHLNDINFKLDNFSKSCDLYKQGILYLEINATDENNKIIKFLIPLTLDEKCK